MGCDIHGPWIYGKKVVERHDGTKYDYWRGLAELNWDRDYLAFSLIADVRNEGRVTKFFEPKGTHPAWDEPDDSWIFRGVLESGAAYIEGCERSHRHTYVDENCHSRSWLSTDELVQCQVWYAAEGRHPAAAKGPSNDFALAIALMRTAESMGYEDVHLGFCFDN